MTRFSIEVEDPREPDVAALLERHVSFCRATTPAEHAFVLDLSDLLDPAISLFALRSGGRLLGVAALKELDRSHGEIKSMHTATEARGLGVGRALVDQLVATAAARGYERLSLETGTAEAFSPARALYASAGFEPCPPFGDYSESPDNTFMSLQLA